MKKYFFLVIIILCLLPYLSCRNNPVDGGSFGNTITGKIVDAYGLPIEGVGIHYIFHLDSVSTPSSRAKTLPSTVIRFDIPFDTVISLTLLRYGTRELIMTLLDHEHLQAGYHSVQFDAGHLTNGLYLAHLTIGDAASDRILALLTDTAHLVQTTPLTTSDAQGKFSLPISVFGIGVLLNATNFSGGLYTVRLSNTIDLVLYKENYQLLIKTVTIDATKSVSMNFRMTQ